MLEFIVAVFARLVGLDRDRAFYPTVLIVIASTYVLFAVMGGSMHALMIESIAMTAFISVERQAHASPAMPAPITMTLFFLPVI